MNRNKYRTGIFAIVFLVFFLVIIGFAGKVKFTYDGAGRLTKAEYENGISITYTYDNAGNLLGRSIDLPSIDLYFPFYQGNAASYTGFGVSNFSDKAAALEFTAFGPDGLPLPFSKNPTTLQLASQNQLAMLGHEIFGADPSALQSGWVQLTSDNAEVGHLLQFGGVDQLDGSVAFTQQSKKLFLTRVFEGPAAFRGQMAATTLSIANPNTDAITAKLTLMTPFGSQTLTLGGAPTRMLAVEKTEVIAAKGILFKTISEVFEQGQTISSGYVVVEVTQGNGAVAFEMVQLTAHNTVMGLNALTGNSAGESFSAQMANGQQAPGISFFTELKLINVGAVTRSVRLRVMDEVGAELATPVDLSLEPGGIMERDVGEIFGLGDNVTGPARVGSIRVEADGPDVIGDVLFGDPGSFNFAAALPLQTQAFTKAIFSQVANAMGFFTGLAFYNPGASTADITIDVYTDTGAKSGQGMVQLEAGKRISKLLTELVPSTAGQVRGYIVVTSNRAVIAQEVFGDNNLIFLSAVPPTVVQ